MYKTLEHLVGNTPLVRLKWIGARTNNTLLAKLEGDNPAGSVKDRPALSMIRRAQERGEIKPGDTLIEPTSGNTGIALAMCAAMMGYRMILVMPEHLSLERRQTMAAFGAEFVLTPKEGGMEAARDIAEKMRDQGKGVILDQFANPDNPLSHYEGTGPEIWRDTDGRITHCVIGAGTGGTITGTGRYLKEASAHRPESDGGVVRIIGADPEGSVYSGGTGRPYFVEGVGEDMWPGNYDKSIPDQVIAVSDADSFAMTRRLAREEGLLVGGSSGMAVVAALKAARDLPESAVVVVILPDSGRGYLAKIFNDQWMRSYGFLSGGEETSVGEVISSKNGELPDLVHIHPNESVRDVINIMNEFGVSHIPVLSQEPPVVMGEVLGAVDERTLTAKLFRGEAKLTDKISEHMGPKLPVIGSLETISAARELLSDVDTVMVTFVGAPVGILTRHDLLAYLSN